MLTVFWDILALVNIIGLFRNLIKVKHLQRTVQHTGPCWHGKECSIVLHKERIHLQFATQSISQTLARHLKLTNQFRKNISMKRQRIHIKTLTPWHT